MDQSGHGGLGKQRQSCKFDVIMMMDRLIPLMIWLKMVCDEGRYGFGDCR